MPSYNHARFLAEAVESVWAQTTSGIELIAVDDGSTDGSARLLEELRARSPIPMSVIVQSNGGVARALNQALESARGEWVCFLASDDRFAPDFVQEQLSAANGKPGDFVQHSNAMIIDELGNQRGTIDQLSTRTPYKGDAFDMLLGGTGRIVSSTLFLRTSLLREVGGLDPAMPAEDFDLHLRLSLRARFDYIEKPIFYARELSDSLGRKPWIWADGIIAAIEKHRDHIGDRYPEILRNRMQFLSETCFASAGWRSGLGWGIAAIRQAPSSASKLGSIARMVVGFLRTAPRAIAHRLLPDVVVQRLRSTKRRGQGSMPKTNAPILKIAIVLPSLAGGGAERVNIELAREFIALGHSVEFILLHGTGELLDAVPQGASVSALDARGMKAALIPLISRLQQGRPDVILASMWPLTWVAMLAARLVRPPIRSIAVEHVDFRAGFRDHPLSRLVMRTFGWAVYGLADAIVCVSKGAREGLVRTAGLPEEAIDVVYNPIRGPTGAPADLEPADEKWWAASPHRLLAVGRLVAQKDHETLVKAMASLQGRRDARLLVLGEGPLRSDLEQLVLRMGLDDRVRFAGHRPNPFAYMARASLLVSSSRWEGFGNVLVEALLAGLPVVSTDCHSGPSEILAGGKHGRLVPTGDPQALAKAIDEALMNPVEPATLVERGKDFEPRRIALQYLELLRSPE